MSISCLQRSQSWTENNREPQETKYFAAQHSSTQQRRGLVWKLVLHHFSGIEDLTMISQTDFNLCKIFPRELTRGGPARKMVPWFFTMMLSSDMAGTYAPPAVQLPRTTAICKTGETNRTISKCYEYEDPLHSANTFYLEYIPSVGPPLRLRIGPGYWALLPVPKEQKRQLGNGESHMRPVVSSACWYKMTGKGSFMLDQLSSAVNDVEGAQPSCPLEMFDLSELFHA